MNRKRHHLPRYVDGASNHVNTWSIMSLKVRLIIFSLCISLIPITIVTVVYFLNVRSILKRQAIEELKIFAEAKRIHLLEFMAAKRGRTADFSSDGFIRDTLEKITRGDSTREEMIGTLTNHLVLNKQPLDRSIKAIAVVDLKGEVVSSTDARMIWRDLSNSQEFVQQSAEPPVKPM